MGGREPNECGVVGRNGIRVACKEMRSSICGSCTNEDEWAYSNGGRDGLYLPLREVIERYDTWLCSRWGTDEGTTQDPEPREKV